jgi:ribosome-associated protein
MEIQQFNRDLSSELKFSASRSSGPGGQNVNKVNSKVELRFQVDQSEFLSENEKFMINLHCRNRINSEGELIITVQTDRSQLKNKEEAIEKFYQLITKALTPRKKRRPSAPTRSSVERRLKLKKESSEKKQLRKKIE